MGKHGVHRLGSDKAQRLPYGGIDVRQILLVFPGNDDGPDAAALGGHGLLPQTADGQHAAP